MDTVFEYITSLQGCTTLPNTLDHVSRTLLSRVNARPRKINMSQPYLGSAERSPLVYLLSTLGSGPIARCTPGRYAQGEFQRRLGWPARSDRVAMLNWTSDKASADTVTSRPITILVSWLVRKGQRLAQNKYPNLLVHLGLAEMSKDSR